jgi:hypothetical protein
LDDDAAAPLDVAFAEALTVPTLPMTKCLGIDTRPEWGEDDWHLTQGSNLQILPGGTVTTRPGLVKDFDAHAQSKGLYSRGGALRAVIPSGAGNYAAATPAGLIYDRIGQGGTFDYTNKIGAVIANETFGFDPVQGPSGYLAVQRADLGTIEHHWVQAQSDTLTDYAATKVALPFQPSAGLVKLANKLFATDPANGYMRFCSSLNGADDWTTAGDAGFEDPRQFASGYREMVALGVHRGVASPTGGSQALIAVMFRDALQLWYVDTTPSNNAFKQQLIGPGTEYPLSCVNVLGDLWFLGRNGFSALQNALQSAEAKYADIGAPVQTLTAAIASGANVISLWSQRRSQFLCFVGTTVYVLSYYPLWQEQFWTTWTLPYAVDAACEKDGVVYVRSGTAVYHLDDTVDTDAGQSSKIAYTFLSQTMGLGSSTRQKSLKRITVQNSGAATYTPVMDGRVLTGNGVTFPGGAGAIGATFQGRGRRFALKITGSGSMRLVGLEIQAEYGGP